jgi:hypothetical protein
MQVMKTEAMFKILESYTVAGFEPTMILTVCTRRPRSARGRPASRRKARPRRGPPTSRTSTNKWSKTRICGSQASFTRTDKNWSDFACLTLGCQIFIDTINQNWEKNTKLPLNYQMSIKCTKWPKYIPKGQRTFSIPRLSQVYPNWDFGFEKKTSGNPGPTNVRCT